MFAQPIVYGALRSPLIQFAAALTEWIGNAANAANAPRPRAVCLIMRRRVTLVVMYLPRSFRGQPVTRGRRTCHKAACFIPLLSPRWAVQGALRTKRQLPFGPGASDGVGRDQGPAYFYTIVGAGQGGGEGGLDIANVFKPALARGELNLIGATTLNEYQKHIEKDAALERRFQPVFVPEPSVAQTIMILRGARPTPADFMNSRPRLDDRRLSVRQQLFWLRTALAAPHTQRKPDRVLSFCPSRKLPRFAGGELDNCGSPDR